MSSPTPTQDEATLNLGQVLGHSNQFRIIQLLGRGGFGEVYLAREDRADRHVAIKVMRPELNGNKKLLRRFRGEYTLGSRVSHPSVVHMFDLAQTPEGVHFIVMEYLDGVGLQARMSAAEKAEGQLGLEQTLNIGWQVSALFAQLHERRIIHRDLKPANLMVVQDTAIFGGARIKLLDFGIAKLNDENQAKQLEVDFDTTKGVALGTVALMGPESYQPGATQGPEIDVYALGCIMYRGIAGNYPFDSADTVELAKKHITAEPIPLTAEDPTTPQDVAELVHSMLAKSPAARPTMAQVAEFCGRKLGVSTMSAGQITVRATSSEIQAAFGDASTGGISVTASAQVPLDSASVEIIQAGPESEARATGQQLAAQSTAVLQKRPIPYVIAGVVAMLLVVFVGARWVNRPAAVPAPASPQITQPAAPDRPVPAAAVTATQPAANAENISPPPATPTSRPVPPEKKHKKKKNVGLVND